MKIVHAIYSLEMGGAEVLVGQLARIQRAEGHEVSVCCYTKVGVIGESLRADGFEVWVPGEAHPLKTMWRYFQRFRKIRPDAVHCHNPAATLHAAVGARMAGVRSIVATRHRLEPLPYNMSVELKFSLVSRFCDWITGISEITCVNARNAPLARRKKIVLVYNGTAPVERVSTEALGKTGFTAVFIGRLAPEKDLGTAIRAIGLAVQQMPELRLWIVGDGAVRPALEALAAELGLAEQVKFWGQRMDTAQFFSAADAFVMSSITEGLPMSLLQAMSLGIPAVLTDVDGGAEVVRMAGCGLLTPVGDAEAMGVAILRMASDDNLRAEFSLKARAAYEERFTLEQMNAGYMNLYLHP